MKYATLLLGLAIFIASTAALAGPKQQVRWFIFIPPVEYDKPYTGKLVVQWFYSETDIRTMCEGKLACAFPEGP